VPLSRLLSKEYAEERRASIRMDRATPSPHGPRPGRPSRDTTYLCVVDRHGNAFSATPSDSTILHTPMVPGLGFAPSDRGLQASLDPSDPNAIQPGKRPRLTPNPGLVVGPGVLMPYGTPGGDVQTQAMTQVLVNVFDRGLDLQAAVEQARWASYSVPITEDPHPAIPNLVRIERSLHAVIGDGLARRGHEVEAWPDRCAYAGGVCISNRDPASGRVSGGADPRRMSYGVGW
jgi:gamma-glutamyltranspeptidase/glutathione hydrolase